MTTKNDVTKEQLRAAKKKRGDAAVYQVMIALAVLCAALLGLRFLRDYYSTPEGIARLATEQFNLVQSGDRIYKIEITSKDSLQ